MAQIKISNVIVGFIIFGVLATLLVSINKGIVDGYGIPETDLKDGTSVMVQLDNLNLPKSINGTVGSLYKITNPDNVFDLLGALTMAGIGVLKIATSIVAFPVEIFGIITGFYEVPPIIISALVTIFITYIGFAILNEYSKRDN